MASITKRGDSYLIRISISYGANNQRKIYNETYKPIATWKREQKREVEEYARQLENRLKYPSLIEGKKAVFVDFLDQWEKDFASDPENMTPQLKDSYKDMIQKKAVPVIGHLKMEDITRFDIRKIFEIMAADGIAHSSKKRVLSALRSVFNYAEYIGLISDNPTLGKILQKKRTEEKEYTIFTPEQRNAFLQAVRDGFDFTSEGKKKYNIHKEVDPQWLALFQIALYGGLRRGEILALTWEDIDFNNKLVTINKDLIEIANPDKSEGAKKRIQMVKHTAKTNSGNRTIDLPQFVIDELKTLKTEKKKTSLKNGTYWTAYKGIDFNKNFVFSNTHTGEALDLHSATRKMKRVIAMYNKMNPGNELPNLRFHDLRHTHATELIYKMNEGKLSLVDIARRLGHKNIQVTLTIYAHYIKTEPDYKVSALYEKELLEMC